MRYNTLIKYEFNKSEWISVCYLLLNQYSFIERNIMNKDTNMSEAFFYENPVVGEHNVDNGVVGCMDFRLRAARAAFMKAKGVVDYDNFVAPGACQEMIEANGQARTFLAIQVALGLHSGEQVWLFQHTDCGAYGGSAKFDSLEGEISFQEQELRKAKHIIETRCREGEIPVPRIHMHVEVIDKERGGVLYRSVE